MAAFLKWSAALHTELVAADEVSSVQNPLSAIKEYKPTIFMVRNNPWNFAVPEWN